MLDRDEMVARIEAVIEARRTGDGAAAAGLIARDATYEIAADVTNLPGFPPGGPAATAIGPLIGLMTYRKVRYEEPIVEGNRVALVMHVDAEANGVPHMLRICGLWEFDGDGKPVSLVEYADTAAMRDWLIAAYGPVTVVPVPAPPSPAAVQVASPAPQGRGGSNTP